MKFKEGNTYVMVSAKPKGMQEQLNVPYVLYKIVGDTLLMFTALDKSGGFAINTYDINLHEIKFKKYSP
jgi:hypothetical protein